MDSYPVKLYVYDLSGGLAKSMSLMFLGKQIDGVWHTAIMVYGNEYFFGGDGIQSCLPGHTILGQPQLTFDLGRTEIPKDMFESYLFELGGSTFHGKQYNLLKHNCNNFSNEIAQFLTGSSIPNYITDLPSEVMSTPLGQSLLPILERAQDGLSHTDGRTFGSGHESNPISSGPASDPSSGLSLVKLTDIHDVQPTPTESEDQILSTFKNPESGAFLELDTILKNGNPVDRRCRLLLESLYRRSISSSPFSSQSSVLHFVYLIQRLVCAQTELPPDVLLLIAKIATNTIEDIFKSSDQSSPAPVLDFLRKLCSSNNQEVIDVASALVLNGAILKKTDESLGFELGCFLIQVLQTSDMSWGPALSNFVQALDILGKESGELIQLAVVQGLDISELRDKSPYATHLHESLVKARQSMY